MHQLIFFVALVWMTVLLVASVVGVITLRSKAGRILMLDLLSVLLVALLILFSTWLRSPYYLDAALVLAVISFLTTVVISRYRAEQSLF